LIERYTHADMLGHWSDAARFAMWLEIECLLVEAFEEEGSVPVGTAARVRERVRLDPARIDEIERVTRHDVIAFLTHVEQQAGDDSRWLHLGLTSSDVVDTAYSVLLVTATDKVISALDELIDVVARRAREHAHTVMVGRTHGMHAEPVTFGLVLGVFKAELDRQRDRLVAARERAAIGKLSGAVGTYAHLEPHHEAFVLSRLGLQVEPVANQVVQRDRHAELFSAIALLGCSIEKISVEVRHLQRSEVQEASEPFGKGQKGSSAMPHKKNPILSENLSGLARLLRGYAMTSMENVALWHQRDISHSSVERIIGPDATILAHFMCKRLSKMLDGLVVFEERMRERVEEPPGFHYSQTVMLALVRKGLVRQRAYEMVQRAAMRCHKDGGLLVDRLREEGEVLEHLSEAELERCFDLEHMLRHVDTILERVL
jgi:adenylosuccinate lyase